MKKRLVLMIVALALSILMLMPTVASAQTYRIALVFKLYGDDWFNRLEEGVKRFAADTGHDAFATGPPLVDSALQIQIIEDLIAQKVDAITVVPISTEALEPVLKKARDAGIVVITHEAPTAVNKDYDIEAFDNASYGAHMMDLLAELMGGEGEYVNFVGALTLKPHMEWVDAAIARQEEAYPNMKRVRERVVSESSQARAYNLAKELLVTYPNLVGFQSSAAPTIAGIGLAIEEMGLEDETFVVGTSLPSIAGQYLQTGAVDMITFWDPAAAAYAMNKVALLVLEGQPIYDGMDLGVPYPGYDNITLDGNVLYGKSWVTATAENVDDYPF